MKLKISILIVLCHMGIIRVSGQQILDTIYANAHKNVTLFFPSGIKRAITGHSGFVFTYDRKKEEHYGLLQAMPGKTSNLLVITTDGRAYGFILQYLESITEHFHFIKPDNAIVDTSTKKSISDKAHTSPIPWQRLKRTCDSLMHLKPPKLISGQSQGIVLRFRDMVQIDRFVYMVFEIKNRSDIDFEMDYLNIMRVVGSKKIRAAYQETLLKTIYTEGTPQTIKQGETRQFVHVLPKFVLGRQEKIHLELKESKGNRLLRVKYNHRTK